MRKYRLEIFVASVFASLLVLLLWQFLSIPSFPALPWVVLGVTLVPTLAVLTTAFITPKAGHTGEIQGENERYAPKVFAQLLGSSVVGIIFFIALATVLNRDNFSKTFDVTERKVHSLSEETITQLKKLEKPVEIICIPELSAQSRYCQESEHLMSLFAQTNPEKVKAAAIRFDDIATLRRVAPTGDRRLILAMEGNRTEVAGPVTESKLTNGIIGLTKGKKVVYFLTGSGEPTTGWDSERNYATLIEFMKKRGYDAREHKVTQGELPADAKVVVAGGNSQPYPAFVEVMLRRFLARGGNLILSVNPYREPGLSALLADVGVTLDASLLIGDPRTDIGATLAQANPLRPAIAIGEFSRVSDMTSKLTQQIGIIDGARPLTVTTKGKDGLTLKDTELVSAFAAVPVSLTEQERNKISLEAPLALKPEANAPAGKSYKVAYAIEVAGAAKLAEGLPPPANAKPEDKAADADKTATAQIVLLGFELVPTKYTPAETSPQVEIPLLAIAQLHKDKDLVTIPTKDYAPKQFRMDRNPGSWLPIFAYILPVMTVLMGGYIWMRRRTA